MRKHKYLRGIFGAELVQQRKAAGYSAAQFAAEIGVSQNTVYRWENKLSLPNPRAWSAIVEWSKKNFTDTAALAHAYTHCATNPTEDVKEIE